jgi:hypothetical protein
MQLVECNSQIDSLVLLRRNKNYMNGLNTQNEPIRQNKLRECRSCANIVLRYYFA